MFMHLLNEAFSDQRWEIHDVLADGDRSSSAARTAATTSVFRTGRRFAYKQMHIIRIRDGKGDEHRVVRDDAALMRQLTA